MSYPLKAVEARQLWLSVMVARFVDAGAPPDEAVGYLLDEAPKTMEPYYLGDEPYRLTFHAAESLPSETVFRPHLPYTPNGFLHPQWAIGSFTADRVTIDALMWVRTEDGVMIVPCTIRNNEPNFESHPWLTGQTIAEALYESEIRTRIAEPGGPAPGPSIFHLMGAFWSLCRQEIFTAERAPLPRNQRRQLAKRYPDELGPRVVTLRASKRRTTPVDANGRQLTTRHIRSAHWHQHWTGPLDDQVLEPRWHGPTIVGPPGAPLIPTAKRLFAVVR